jgi:hypothetical protein
MMFNKAVTPQAERRSANNMILSGRASVPVNGGPHFRGFIHL